MDGETDDALPARPQVADSLLDLIGNTPLVRLDTKDAGIACTIALKLEFFNPGGSVKDRPAVAMIEAAERDGLLRPGGTIVEPTSGNTGVGLAIVAAQRGYRCIFVMTDKVAPEKVSLLRAYGAEVIVCPVAVEPDDPNSYYSVAERLMRETPGAFRPNQYDNQWNPWAHEQSTGPEIWRQTAGRITHFVAGIGTGGTITGVARYLKTQNPDVGSSAPIPAGSVYSGGSGRPYLVEGIGEDFWPSTYDPSRGRPGRSPSPTRRASSPPGGSPTSRGSSSAGRAGRRSPPLSVWPGTPVPTTWWSCSSPTGAAATCPGCSTTSGWRPTASCAPAGGPSARSSRRGATPSRRWCTSIRRTQVERAVDLMREYDVSQLPVAKGEMPLATAEIFGSVDELVLMDLAFRDPGVFQTPVEKVMGPRLPTIGIGQPIELAVELLERSPALVVLAGGRPQVVLSRTDVLSFVSEQLGAQPPASAP